MSASVKESTVLRAIVRELERMRADGERIWWLKTHGGPMQRAGVPDLLVCFRGEFVALEVKRPGEQATALQAETMRRINAAGGVTAVVHDVAELRAALVI